jgi:hypothetical protein
MFETNSDCKEVENISTRIRRYYLVVSQLVALHAMAQQEDSLLISLP